MSPLLTKRMSFNFILFLQILMSTNSCNFEKQYDVLLRSKYTGISNSRVLSALVLVLSLLTVMYTKPYKTYELSVYFGSAIIGIWLLPYILMYTLQHITHFLHFPPFPSEYSVKLSAVMRLWFQFKELISERDYFTVFQTDIQNLECFFL